MVESFDGGSLFQEKSAPLLRENLFCRLNPDEYH
jgi:hypothetical protein